MGYLPTRVSVAAVGVAAAILLATATASGADARPSGPLVPSSGVLLGAWSNPNTADWWTQTEVLSRESLIGRRSDIDAHIAWYASDGSGPAAGETSELSWDAAYGRIPMLTFDGPTRPFPGLAAIASGKYDTSIRAWAVTVKSIGSPVFIRPWWEMNGPWWPWGDNPSEYVQAWRHLHDIFESAGATNAVWIWAPNVHDGGGTPHWTNYYPGDAYVDWVGIDGYNWGTATYAWGQSQWRSFAQTFGGSPSIYGDYSTDKPIMIAEFSSVESGGDKGQWWRDIPSVLEQSFPSIAALVVWDSIDHNVPADLRIDTSTSSLDGFKAMVQAPYLNAAGAVTLTTPLPTLSPIPAVTTTTTTYSGRLTRQHPSRTFPFTSGIGMIHAALSFAKCSQLSLELVSPDGSILASRNGASILTLDALAAAGAYEYRVSGNVGCSFDLTSTTPTV